jgi:hypothetical protein
MRDEYERTEGEPTHSPEARAAIEELGKDLTNWIEKNGEKNVRTGPAKWLNRRRDGTRWEVIVKDDGGDKIVSAAAGMSVTREWVEGNRLRLTITGLTVGSGAMIDATFQLGLFDGSSLDTVSLST